MTSTMQMVTRLNNAGADLLAAGEVDAAFKNFRYALELLRRLCEQSNNAPSPQASGQVDSSSVLPQQVVESLKHIPFQPNKPTFRHSHYIFSEAMEFNQDVDQVAVENLGAYQPVFFAIIQFNLGLALQMKSKEAGERALFRALAWYDACLETVQAAVEAAVPLQLDLILAALNNLAIVNYDLCQFSKVRQIYQKILDILVSFSKTNYQSHGLLPEDEMNDLLLNIMLLQKAVIAPAA